jgi:hypothetical protein
MNAWPTGPKEPVYQGKKLSEWVHVLTVGTEYVATYKAAREAILQDGLFVEWVCYEPSGGEMFFVKKLENASPWIKDFGRRYLYRRQVRAIDALSGISMSGLHDAWAVTVLGDRLQHARQQESRRRILSALQKLVTNGADISSVVPAILSAEIQEAPASGSRYHILGLHSQGLMAGLANCLRGRDKALPAEALGNLYVLCLNRREAPRVLEEGLASSDPEIRAKTEWCLGQLQSRDKDKQ